MSWLSKVGSGISNFVSGGSLFSGGMDLLGGYYQNKQAKAAAEAQMAFQQGMSNTAYQRMMKDMRKAGLNPMLAMKMGGATTPTGATYTPQNIGSAATAGRLKGEQARMASAQTQTQVATAKSIEIENKIRQRTLDDLEKRGITEGDIKNTWQNLAGSEVYKALTKEMPPAELANWLMAIMQGDYSKASELIKRNKSGAKSEKRLMSLNEQAINIVKRGNYKWNNSEKMVKQHFSMNKDNPFAYEYKKYQWQRKSK